MIKPELPTRSTTEADLERIKAQLQQPDMYYLETTPGNYFTHQTNDEFALKYYKGEKVRFTRMAGESIAATLPGAKLIPCT